jgi:hypothetical protein
MMRSAMTIAVALALGACAREQAGSTADTPIGAQTPESPVVPADVQTAAAVKRGIDAAPDKADSILSANGLTVAGFDSLMFRIAEDSVLRAAFASASR